MLNIFKKAKTLTEQQELEIIAQNMQQIEESKKDQTVITYLDADMTDDSYMKSVLAANNN